MKPEKILLIIKEQNIFTVKSENKKLMKTVEKMEQDGQLELKDRHRDYYYYGAKDGKEWSLKNGYNDGPHAGACWTDRYW